MKKLGTVIPQQATRRRCNGGGCMIFWIFQMTYCCCYWCCCCYWLIQLQLVQVVTGYGLAPPNPDWVGYESVYDYKARRRQKQQQHIVQNQLKQQQVEDEDTIVFYEPKYIPLQYCRYMTNNECAMEDEKMKQITMEHKEQRVQQQQQQQQQQRRQRQLYQQDNNNNNNNNNNQVPMNDLGPVGRYRLALKRLKKQQQEREQQVMKASDESSVSSSTSSSSSFWNSTRIMRSRRHLQQQQQYEYELLQRTLRSTTKRRQLNPSVVPKAKVLVLLMKFKGHENRVVPTKEYIELLLNGESTSTSGSTNNNLNVTQINPIGSMKEFLRYSSLGKYRVVYNVIDWKSTNVTETEFAQSKSALLGPSITQHLFTSVLTELDRTNQIQWLTDHYVDEFGYLYHLLVLHSGYAAEIGPLPCLANSIDPSAADPINRVWSQGASSLGSDGWLSKDYYQLNGFSINSAFDIVACNKSNIFIEPVPFIKIGMIIHEYSHGFQLPDLYDQDYSETQRLNIGGTSKFALMSNGYGWKRNAAIPGHHDPWSRYQLGWLEPIEITYNGHYAIQPSEISGHIYKISSNFPFGEYLLIENRQPIKWDSDLPSMNQTGILIYHVDELADGQRTRGYPGHPNWPTDHYMVSIVPADGLYDIEKGVNMGDENDFWRYNSTLKSGGDDPNTDSIQSGNRKVTGIEITITSHSGFIMTFEVSGLTNAKTNRNITKDPYMNNDINENNKDPIRTNDTVQWLLDVLMGVAALIGLVAIIVLL